MQRRLAAIAALVLLALAAGGAIAIVVTRPIPAGVDGEAVVLDAPLRFVTRPGVLRVRIAPQHPGASPSAALPDSPWAMLRALARLGLGRSPGSGDLLAPGRDVDSPR